MNIQPSKGAVIYLRCSPRPKKENGEDDNDSIAVQERLCREYCKKQGYFIEHIFKDEQISGSKSDETDRPGIWKAVYHLKAGTVLVIANWDRLARDVWVYEMLMREIKSKKASVESVSQVGNLDTPTDKLIRGFFMLFAEYERSMASVRTKHAANVYQYQQGRVMGRRDRIPYGYMIDPDNVSDTGKDLMIENPGEIRIVRIICSLRDDDEYSYNKIVQYLNQHGSSKRNGRPWDAATVRIIYRRAKGVK